jgi:hypothetical protein
MYWLLTLSNQAGYNRKIRFICSEIFCWYNWFGIILWKNKKIHKLKARYVKINREPDLGGNSPKFQSKSNKKIYKTFSQINEKIKKESNIWYLIELSYLPGKAF